MPSNDGQSALGNQLKSPLHAHPEVTAVRMSHASSSHSMMSHSNMSHTQSVSHGAMTQSTTSIHHTQSDTISIKQEINCIEQDLDSDSLKIDE